MALDLDALRDAQRIFDSKKGESSVLYASKIDGTMSLRILPPLPNLNGVFFLPATTYWLGTDTVKSLYSWSTFNKPCPIEDALLKAKQLNDKLITAILAKIRRSSVFLMPVLILDPHTGQPLNKDNPKIFSCGASLAKMINAKACHKNYAPDITDRVEGFSFEVTRTGEGIGTQYALEMDRHPSEMPAVYYQESVIPDVVKFVTTQLKSEEEIDAIMKSVLYGEAIPAKYEKPQPSGGAKLEMAKKSTKPATRRVMDDVDDLDDLGD